ncbi:uncharacterized protein LOC132713969 [Ruditapes philippinarum]|uniref:uncharacterized protein LOC132713969 n=1 Tax=Ruditapes philippinarum TaxID=129788 RepID=UPI00295B69E2|nr:uncharacterized protein LOC132713969 [Ruditapes philippinarum]
MPAKNNLSQKDSTKKNKRGKRKVISPLYTDTNTDNTRDIDQHAQSGQTGYCVGQSCVSDVSIQNKRLHTSSPEHFIFDINKMQNENFTGQNVATNVATFTNPQYGSQFSPSPTYSYTQLQPMQQQFSPTPPTWATELIENIKVINTDIKMIKKSVEKIDGIEKTVNRICLKVDELENKYRTMDIRVNETESAAAFLSNEFEETKKKLANSKSDIKKFGDMCISFEKQVSSLETDNMQLNNKVNDLEARSLRDNLLFHGFNESPDENCEALIQNFIKHDLGIDQKEINIERAHRIGTNKGKGIRPVVVKFLEWKDRELVRKTANDKFAELKMKKKGVGVQQTRAVLAKRKELYSIMDREKKNGRFVKWAGAKLLVSDHAEGPFHEITS